MLVRSRKINKELRQSFFMIKSYRKHIISTLKHQVWLHRTHTSNIEGILKEGLYYGNDLSSTATLQPREMKKAERVYRQTHKGSNAVVAIKIPEQIAREYFRQWEGMKGSRQAGYETDKRVSYWHPGRKGFAIQRQHVHGWIDRETGEYTENPYKDEPQKFTETHFPLSLYGGLELTTKPKTPSFSEDKYLPALEGGKRVKLKRPPKNLRIVL